ncbi:MAG: tRNA pseudouridine(38-40) synthase TruA [Hymenobacteraceae bacterium]|nr:tRNA pseudouridine(38-40) synthase TruA [Hymenobacteraceae bacterium]
MRYFLELAYDGTHYHGWQIQPNARTVQEVLDDALSKVLRHPITSTGSGRTDTGVHASQQFVHFDVPEPLQDVEQLLYRLNKFLPKDIALKRLRPVQEQAHARFDALARTYDYHITLQKSPFLRRYAYFLSRQPDVEKMNEAAAILLKHQDYTTFSKVKGDTPHYLCDISFAEWQQEGSSLIFTIRANRFLRGMVRLVVGTLLDVGAGKITPNQFEEIIKAQDRQQASGAAAAEGLYLSKVEYPENLFLPA